MFLKSTKMTKKTDAVVPHSHRVTPAFLKMSIPQKIGLGLIALGFGVVVAIAPQYIKASDHDDGEVDTKGRNLNLTDLFVFREKDQNRSAAANDLIFVMNTNPRSLARQQYFFSTNARYEFKVTRVGNKNAQPTGREDVVLRFEFSPPTANGQQEFKLSAISDGTTRVATGKTTPLKPKPTAAPVINQLYLGGSRLTVFAGLREDPFFFDVEQFFRVRAGALGIGPAKAFRPPERAIDFAKGYNVNAIVVRIPQSFLRGYTAVNTFDVWQTIAVKDPVTDRFQQFERLARPGINEGLVVTNDFLNAFNTIPPTADLSAAAAPVRAEAKKTLLALGNSNTRADALLNAFLPDVMRIDTTIPSGYANALNAQGSPIAGRKLTDDVIDITLSVLTNGAITTDNVSYAGTPGNPAQGHKPLQTAFPYLALPN